MKFKLVKTKNVQRLHSALEELKGRNCAMPGLGLLFGRTGAGKTTALFSAIGIFDALFVRADAVTSLSSLLDSICFELTIDSLRTNPQKLGAIREALRERPRPLFVDEADYLTKDGRMLEVLRDIHDTTGIPVILIGMEAVERKLTRHPQFARRISQRIEFNPCDLADTALVAKELCEVAVADDLLKKMHSRAKGSIGHIVVALSLFEEMARDNGWAGICAEQWGSRPMFLGDLTEA